MLIKQFQKVRLKTGEIAVIIEVLEPGKAFLADIEKDDGNYETDEMLFDGIASVFIETEQPLKTA